MQLKSIARCLAVFILVTLLAACGSSSSDNDDNGTPSNTPDTPATYRITLTNITHSQPLSPVALIFHTDNYMAWEVGLPASLALEVLAEGGDPTDFIQAAENDPGVVRTAMGADVIPPGAQESLELVVDAGDQAIYLTIATMLVNTNDAFAGLSAKSISALAVGESLRVMASAYDAGTEANSESAASIPGPAAGGEGFNAVRDDEDFVRGHSGVISSQDGLDGSVLTGAHRWDNPVFNLVVTRTG